jgi:hypothetical protein
MVLCGGNIWLFNRIFSRILTITPQDRETGIALSEKYAAEGRHAADFAVKE